MDLDKLRTAIDETERVALAALNHPTTYDPATRDYVVTGKDDGAWSARDDCSSVESANLPYGDGGIIVYDEGGHTEGQAAHIALHDPERELRMVAAHRKILDEVFAYEAQIDGEWGCGHSAEAIAAGKCTNPNEIPAIVALAEGYGIEP